MNLEKEQSLHSVFSQVMRLHFIRSHSLLEKTGLYPGQPPLLFSLYKENGQSQKDLADKLKIKPATMAVMIKRMEKTKTIRREQDEVDKRISRIYLTDLGVSICKDLSKIHEQIEEECFKGFSIEEKILMRRLMMQIRDNLQEVCSRENSSFDNFCGHHSNARREED